MWDIFRPYIWDHKWLQSNVKYVTHYGKNKVDVKSVFVDDYMVHSFTKELVKRCTTNDQKAYMIWKWVKHNIKYKSDYKLHGVKEYWQTPHETYFNKTGDCEDGAILMVKMWRYAGIPAYQCKLAAGYVEVDYKPVGHAYAIYLKEYTNKFIIMDWCYWAGKVPARWRFNKSHADCPEYQEIWWTSNDKNSWAQHDIIIRDGLHD